MRKRYVGIKAGIIVPIRIITPDITIKQATVKPMSCRNEVIPAMRLVFRLGVWLNGVD
ncbi:MAG: hypothetical protein QF879_18590 [Candidatus Latescibacteria bacterium]|nr:hypothetical protein [Candidatus Latescibacterota bacterium]